MINNNILLDKSFSFALNILTACKEAPKSYQEKIILTQLIKSATSIGANLNEAIYGNSRADFISKLTISLKETGETIYWLQLLQKSSLLQLNTNNLLP